MSFYAFRLLAPEMQVYYVLTRGTFLAWRWKEERQLMLHYLPDGGRGFFVELGVDEEQTRFVVVRSFSSSVPLEEYAYGVRLPGE